LSSVLHGERPGIFGATVNVALDSAETTRAFGEWLSGLVGGGDCVTLSGELGAGKTTLVQGLAWGLGLARNEYAPSPTYAIALTYPTRPALHHIDLYRVDDRAGTLLSDDYFTSDAVAVIEWPERAPAWLPEARFVIVLSRGEGDARRAEVTATTAALDDRLRRYAEAAPFSK
jgi:tRNA threonylcarbamoyladenosine biosynthesis protein TsaE